MRKISNSHINVIGDSLESCLLSRKLAEREDVSAIHHYTTGNLGGVFIDNREQYYLGLMNKSQKDKIQQYISDEVFEEVIESYIKIPQKKINFQNSYDGYIRFPFTIKSFENEFDLDDVFLDKPNYEKYIANYLTYKNVNKLLKELFEDSFYMNIIKKIGTNIWNTNISQLDPTYIYKNLLHLETIDYSEPVVFYRPSSGYTGLCKKLLNCDKIHIVTKPRDKIKLETKNQIDVMSYYCEYYDYYYDFVFGSLNYVYPTIEIHKKNILNMDKFAKVQTPYDKKYAIYYQINQDTYKAYFSNYTIDSNNFSAKQLIPSIQNMRKYSEYKKMSDLMNNSKIIL